MDLKQQRVLQSHRRTQAWCAANPGLVPPPVGPSDTWTPLTRQLDTLNALVVLATEGAAEQVVQARNATLAATDESALRKHLRDEMHSVAQVAQALRKTIPGIGVLKMPAPQVQVEGLLKAADAFTRQAFTYESVLIEHGMAPDFVAQLRDGISALKASVDGRGSARASQVGKTKQITDSLRLGTQHVRIMDAALTKALKNDSAKLAEWKNATRVTLKGVSANDITITASETRTGTPLLVATPMLVSQTSGSVPLTNTPATPPANAPELDTKAA